VRYSPQVFFRAQQPAPTETGFYYALYELHKKIGPVFYGQESEEVYLSDGRIVKKHHCVFFGPVPEVREASKCLGSLPTYSEERGMLEEEYRHAGETFHV